MDRFISLTSAVSFQTKKARTIVAAGLLARARIVLHWVKSTYRVASAGAEVSIDQRAAAARGD